jgi:hypothetical protein
MAAGCSQHPRLLVLTVIALLSVVLQSAAGEEERRSHCDSTKPLVHKLTDGPLSLQAFSGTMSSPGTAGKWSHWVGGLSCGRCFRVRQSCTSLQAHRCRWHPCADSGSRGCYCAAKLWDLWCACWTGLSWLGGLPLHDLPGLHVLGRAIQAVGHACYQASGWVINNLFRTWRCWL